MAKEKEHAVKDNQNLKFKRVELEESNKNLVKKNKVLKDKNHKLETELDKIKSFIEKFIFSSQKLEMILNNQQAIFDRVSIGFRSSYKQKTANNLFKKSSSESLTCYCYGKIGHESYVCNFRKNTKIK